MTLSWDPRVYSDLEAEIIYTLPEASAAFSQSEIIKFLMTETESGVRKLCLLTKRSMLRVTGHPEADLALVTVDPVEVELMLQYFDEIRLLEPHPWCDPRLWWPECPLSSSYRYELERLTVARGKNAA